MAATDQPLDQPEPPAPAVSARERVRAEGGTGPDTGARMDPTTSSLGEMVSDGGVPPASAETEPVTNSGFTDSNRRSGVEEHPAAGDEDAEAGGEV